jgi:hypothetical protein
MSYDLVFQSTSKCLPSQNFVVFDVNNKEHRKAYATWELTGRWPIRFQTEWPFVTVPQTILSKLAQFACSKEFAEVAREKNLELKDGFQSYRSF